MPRFAVKYGRSIGWAPGGAAIDADVTQPSPDQMDLVRWQEAPSQTDTRKAVAVLPDRRKDDASREEPGDQKDIDRLSEMRGRLDWPRMADFEPIAVTARRNDLP